MKVKITKKGVDAILIGVVFFYILKLINGYSTFIGRGLDYLYYDLEIIDSRTWLVLYDIAGFIKVIVAFLLGCVVTIFVTGFFYFIKELVYYRKNQ